MPTDPKNSYRIRVSKLWIDGIALMDPKLRGDVRGARGEREGIGRIFGFSV